ncbi:MAG: hypothetical protein CMJ72_15610 [Planctomycetaceae bacterium]|nr:hypothetical protein [Planctomycetaceae bacterium]
MLRDFKKLGVIIFRFCPMPVGTAIISIAIFTQPKLANPEPNSIDQKQGTGVKGAGLAYGKAPKSAKAA